MDTLRTPIKIKDDNSCNFSSIQIPATPLLQTLGYGTGVAVYRMKRSSELNTVRSPWALKRINKKIVNKDEIDNRLKYEAEILRKINHPNIVGFRAFIEMSDGRNCLAMEDCDISLGDLIENRFDESLGPFEESKIIKMANNISNALNYLHTVVRLLHGDLKSFNVLVKKDFVCKLCDFGVTLKLNSEGKLDLTKGNENIEYIGTGVWCPPEVINGSEIITDKADIFSFGLVIWEMLALKPPHCNDEESLDESELDESLVENKPGKSIGTRPILPYLSIDDYYKSISIFFSCTEEIPDKRPTAEQIFNITESIL